MLPSFPLIVTVASEDNDCTDCVTTTVVYFKESLLHLSIGIIERLNNNTNNYSDLYSTFQGSQCCFTHVSKNREKNPREYKTRRL